MRDLSVFPANHFDLVWQSYSINYVPSVAPVFQEVARVLQPGGFYQLAFANPFIFPMDSDWNGTGYVVSRLYLDGEDLNQYDPVWEVEQPDGSVITLDRPHEFRHTLSTVLTTLAENGFTLLKFTEWKHEANPLIPGSWPHFTQVAPPYFGSYWRLRKEP